MSYSKTLFVRDYKHLQKKFDFQKTGRARASPHRLNIRCLLLPFLYPCWQHAPTKTDNCDPQPPCPAPLHTYAGPAQDTHDPNRSSPLHDQLPRTRTPRGQDVQSQTYAWHDLAQATKEVTMQARQAATHPAKNATSAKPTCTAWERI